MRATTFRRLSILLLCLALSACADDDGPTATPSACAPATGAPSAQRDALLQVLNDARTANGLNAIIFSATSAGEPLLTTALGNSTPGVPATTDMHFRVGMPAEQFETLLMLRLAERGELDLDAPVSRWFPTYPHAERATVRMLAASSTGFGDYVYGPADPARGIPSFDDVLYADPKYTFSTSELIARSQPPYQQPQFVSPGEDWRYSHTNFVLLGAILESAGRGDYADLLRRHVLTPLGLRNTAYAATSEIARPVLHAYTSERGTYEDSTDWSPSWTSYSGRLNSTVCDLTVWARAFGTGALLTPETAAQITAPANVGLGANTSERYFGLGVIVNNGWLIGDANFFGWHTATAYYPPKQIALAFTSTEGPGTRDTNSTSKKILRAVSRILTPEAPITLP